MDPWIPQDGYPQVDVSLADGRLRLGQRRFLAIPDETDTTLWKVPLKIRGMAADGPFELSGTDRKSTRLNSSHVKISYAVFCLKKKRKKRRQNAGRVSNDSRDVR